MYQTVVFIILLLAKDPLVRLLRKDKSETQNSKSLSTFISKLNRWDQVSNSIIQSCRLIQYGLIFIAGYLQSSALYMIDHAGLMMVGRAHRLDTFSNMMSSTRKMIRIARLPGVFRDVNGWMNLYGMEKGKLKDQ